MPISTHVLDTMLGRPGAGVFVSAARLQSGEWVPLSSAVTDQDGRCKDLLGTSAPLEAGIYRLRFDIEAYHASIGVQGLFPYAEIAFRVHEGQLHYHIPLLLTPNSYTTYRGS